MSEATKFAENSWNWEDVSMLREGWSRERCEKFLKRNETRILDAMTSAGWAAIENRLREDW